MPIRHFNGTSDRLTFAVGGSNLTGAWSVAVLLRRAVAGEKANWWNQKNAEAGSAFVGTFTGTNHPQVLGGPGSPEAPGQTVGAGHWALLVVTKEAFGVKPIFYLKDLTAGTALVHEEGSATIPNLGTQAGGTIILGSAASGFFSGDIAAFALWAGTKLSEAVVTELVDATYLTDWAAVATHPTTLLLLDQESTSEAVEDRVGTSNQTAISGTTIQAGEPPIPFSKPKSRLRLKTATGTERKWLRHGTTPHRLSVAGPSLGSFRIAHASVLTDPIVRPDEFVVTQWWQSERIAAAKAHGSKVLIYQNLTRAQAPDGSGHYNSGLTLAEAEAIGAKSTTKDEDEGGYVCKPNVGGYPALWAEKVTAKALEVDADGVFLDDLNTYDDATEDLAEAEWYAQLEACNAVVGPALTEAGLIGIPNMSGCIGERNLEHEGWLEDQFRFYDGGFDEFFTTFPSGATMSTTYIEEAMKVMARQTARGKLYLCGVNGSEAQIRFAVALALLQQQHPGRAMVFASPAGPDYGKQAWTGDLEHALALGVSIDTAVTGERSYTKGSVSADLGAKTGVIIVA